MRVLQLHALPVFPWLGYTGALVKTAVRLTIS